MKLIISLLIFLLPTAAFGIQKIAVVDTGLDINDNRFQEVLCKQGHWDFVTNSMNPVDTDGHGTHVAGIIKKYAQNANYCLIIIKYYDKNNPGYVNSLNVVKSFQYAAQLGVSIINFSGGGFAYTEQEYKVIEQNPKITFVVAAGNENKDIDKPENYYFPASYKLSNIISVGSLDHNLKKAKTSNYGTTVKAWEIGDKVSSTYLNGEEWVLSGTSMAAPAHTGKLILQRNK